MSKNFILFSTTLQQHRFLAIVLQNEWIAQWNRPRKYNRIL
ncbi:hypothetical protein B4168_3064 [Anoxybacillus flavithermus]|nr:hypothetical protein B4168_3064 [Anoxybacillus flavithermus]OAO86351.1 hypothetical protein GT23_2244 [Parageobacillus thermoglucosidasius]